MVLKEKPFDNENQPLLVSPQINKKIPPPVHSRRGINMSGQFKRNTVLMKHLNIKKT